MGRLKINSMSASTFLIADEIYILVECLLECSLSIAHFVPCSSVKVWEANIGNRLYWSIISIRRKLTGIKKQYDISWTGI